MKEVHFETMPGVSCPHQRLYCTVQPLRAEASHPGVDSLFNRSQSNRKYDYKLYMYTDMWMGKMFITFHPFIHSSTFIGS